MAKSRSTDSRSPAAATAPRSRWGKFTLINASTAVQTVAAATITFTQPRIFISATLDANAGKGISQSTLVPPEKSSVFNLDPVLVIPAGGRAACALTGSLVAPKFGRGRDGVV